MATELDMHSIGAVIPGEATIWRYMDLPKFVAMLATNWLWFAKAATFRDDPWEGFGTAERFQPQLLKELPTAREEPDGRKTQALTTPQMFSMISDRSAAIFENA